MSTTKIDFILWTGDSPPHDIWEENQSMQLNRISWISNLIEYYFPNTPVFPCFGNHDAFPVDQFALPPLNAWLMDAVTKDWARWIPADSQETMLYGGYYTSLVRPGLRMVALNTMYCDGDNFWLWLNNTDACQLVWLQGVLQSAKDNGEKVYMIGHIPPGSDGCHDTYPETYYNLVDQYHDIIAGQFFGHTHYDMFQLFRDPETNTIPLSVAFIAPSVEPSETGYGQTNPSYRVFEADPSSFEVLDYSQYYLDLPKAQQTGEVQFELEYSAKSSYSLPDMSPVSWNNLFVEMALNRSVFMNFYSHIGALGPMSDPTCEDQGCINHVMCDIQALPALQKACSNSY